MRISPLVKKLLLALVSVGIVLGVLEAGLALLGVDPYVLTEDPFIGFSAGLPLYVPIPGRTEQLYTSPGKRRYFNTQSFSRRKSPGVFREKGVSVHYCTVGQERGTLCNNAH